MPMEESFPITAAQLSGNFCETLFYGMYLVTCGFCARTLLLTGKGRDERWLRPSEIRWLMAIVALVMFVILTFDTAIGLLHNFHAFIQAQDAKVELLNLGDWINIARTVDQGLVTNLGDFILIYRCWIVYGRRWLIIVPSVILLLGTIAVEMKAIETEANSTVKYISLNAKQARPWNISFFAITTVQNTITTGILIWRIWQVERQCEMTDMFRGGSAGYHPQSLRNVIKIIAESGAAFTIMAFITFVVSLSGSEALYPTSDMTLITTGIAFNAILVRFSARRDQQFEVFDYNERMAMAERGHTGISTLNFATLGTGQSVASDIPGTLEQIIKGHEDSNKDVPSRLNINSSSITAIKSVVTT